MFSVGYSFLPSSSVHSLIVSIPCHTDFLTVKYLYLWFAYQIFLFNIFQENHTDSS